jgi:heptosyltransferase-1
MKKILIIKTSALGDIVQTYPVLDFLRDKFPDAIIDWVIEKPYAEVVQAHPKINNVLCVNTKKWRKGFFNFSKFKEIRDFWRQLRSQSYDVAFDLQGNIKSGLILSQVKSKQKAGFGKHSVSEWPNLFFTDHRFNPPVGGNIRDDYLAIVKEFFCDISLVKFHDVVLNISEIQKNVIQSILSNDKCLHGPKVIVCPGSAWRNKQLTIECLIAFLSKVQHHLKCNFLFLWGSSDEKDVVDQLYRQFITHSLVIDHMCLPMVQNLMIAADLIIAMDSLPLHLAGTTSTPSFSIFGPSSAQKYKPIGVHHHAFQGHCPYGRTLVKRCPILRTCPTGACIRQLSGDELFAEFGNWWDSLGVRH